MGTCIRPRCKRPAVTRRLCASHYTTARLDGDVPPSEAVDTPCAWCGELMVNRKNARAKYCSPQCKERARIANRADDRAPVLDQRTCVQCGDSVPTTRFGKAITCSADCAITYQNRVKSERLHAERKTLDRHCRQCGEPISPEKRNNVLYCTRKCKSKAGHFAARSGEQRLRSQKYMREYTYGLSDEQYQAMLTVQQDRCAICGTTDWGGRGDGPHIDHDHVTGQVRALLCRGCNNGLGNFGDDPERLDLAATYLRRFAEVEGS